MANPNDKVNVQYMAGTVKRDVKYKSVEQDVESGRAVLVDQVPFIAFNSNRPDLLVGSVWFYTGLVSIASI